MKLRRESRFKNADIWWVVIFLLIVGISFKVPVGQQLNLLFAPALNIVQAPAKWYEELSLWFKNSQEIQSNYLLLKEKSSQEALMRQELESVRVENEQLRKYLNITQIENYKWRVAKVVSRGPETKSQRLMIQIAIAHSDDVVVSHEGLVGLVDSVDGSHAAVRTILDASVAVPVTMHNSKLAGLVRGDGVNLSVDFVPLSKAPKVGDVLITSGAGGIYPAGMPVALVKKVEAIQGDVFANVTASPVAYWQRDAWLAVATKQNAK